MHHEKKLDLSILHLSFKRLETLIFKDFNFYNPSTHIAITILYNIFALER
jgi:hypothetical protein